MEQIKRERSTSCNYNDNKRKKIEMATVETNYLSNTTITYFEDLSNELIYEIYEFLDFYHVYKAFFNLNIRFRNLLINSTLPIYINISVISKSTFHRYYTDIITRNKHRINSLRLSNPFIYNLLASTFPQLETLVLENIESKYLENLLHKLISLPCLSSLVIIPIDNVQDRNSIYLQIFRLQALKYCRLSLDQWLDYDSLPFATNEYSPIEYLVINNSVYLHQLDSFLSYVPQLRHLSFDCLQEFSNKRTKIYPIVLKHLTHVFLKLINITFDQFELLIRDLFYSVQVFHISITCYSNIAYIDANRWEHLIVSHMSNLRIFDIQHDVYPSNDNDQLAIEAQIKQFTSLFWIERQWFFAHQYYRRRNLSRSFFYSTDSYRRKDYRLYTQSDESTCVSHYETNLNSVQHVHIQSESAVINCLNYFPNAIELTFEDGFVIQRKSIVTILNRIIPLKQLTKLNIKCHCFSFKKVIELLYHTSNIHTLIFISMPRNTTSSVVVQQSEIFRSVFNMNIITNVTINERCTFKKIQVLVALCPRLQHLAINTCIKDLESIVRLLLRKTNQNTERLSLLCFLEANQIWFETLKTSIETEKSLDDYLLKLIGRKLYVWW